MQPSTPPVTRPVLAGAFIVAMALAAGIAPGGAAPEHDGVWKVKTSAETGACNTNYDVSVAVKNGKVSYAGHWPVKATGGIDDFGLIKMEISGPGHRVKATGLVRGDTASGDWSATKSDCTGSWVARRT